jgi:hypothetical protein
VSWFDRFRRSACRSTIIACYLRENGPIAYELPLFGDAQREPLDAMFESGLSWYWSVLRSDGTESREWIELTRWSMAALLSNLSGANSSGHVVMIGIEPLDGRVDIANNVTAWAKRFVVDESSPLHVVIDHPGNGSEYVFVAQQPPENVRVLLQNWGIDRASAERRAYPRLREHALESLVERIRV